MFEHIDNLATPIAFFGWLMPAAQPADLVLKWLADERARRRLAEYQRIDPRFAKDVGVTPEQIATECAAPFWSGLTLSRGDVVR